jgi:hypothetical protein
VTPAFLTFDIGLVPLGVCWTTTWWGVAGGSKERAGTAALVAAGGIVR